MSSDQFAFSLEVAGKAGLYAALIPAVGVCAIRSLLLPMVATLSAREVDEVHLGLARVGMTAAALVLVALVFRLLTQAIAVGIPADAPLISQIRFVAVETRWGGGWRVQMVAASVFCATTVLTRVRPGTSNLLPSLACLALCYSVPLVGHAAGSPWRVVLHGSHVLAAGSWLGTLAVLLVMGFFGGRNVAPLLRGFSPVALSGAAVLLLTGAVSSWLYVGTVSNLWSSTYGWLLDLKIALFFGAAGCGYVNWRRFSAERTAGASSTESPSLPATPAISLTIEVLFAAAVILVTAVLTETSHP